MGKIWQWVGGSASGFLSLLAPIKVSFTVIFVVIFFDLVTGLWASRIKQVGISSRRLRKSIKKMVGYFEVIFILFFVEYGFDFSFGTYRFVGGFICFVEVISILENTAIITDNKIFIRIIRLIRGKAASTYGELADEIIKEKNDE